MENLGLIDNKYSIENQIGFGLSSKVYVVRAISDSKKYAAKVFSEKYDFFHHEIEMLKEIKLIKNDYVVNVIDSGIGSVQIGDKLMNNQKYIIFEYMANGALFDYINLGETGFKEKHCKLIFSKILKGVEAFHKKGICHRDIKLQNILVDENFNPKICDFGFSTINNGHLSDYLGTKNYIAPEIELNKLYDGFKVDIFSLGITLFTLLKLKPPFEEAKKTERFYRLIYIKHFNLFWEKLGDVSKDLSDEFKKLFNKMVSFNPKDRPDNIEKILNDDWFKEIRELKGDELEKLEEEIKEEFLNKLSIIKDKKKINIQTEGIKNIICNDNLNLMKGGETDIEYFNLSLIPQFAKSDIKMDNYIKVIGSLEPNKFMNILANEIKEKYEEKCIFEISDNKLKFNIIFVDDKEDEVEKEELPKEVQEELEKLKENEEEEYEENIDINKCILQIKLFESYNGGYLIRFTKKKGDLYQYYKKVDEIVNIIQILL